MSFDTSPGYVRRAALLTSIGALILAGLLAYHAGSNEISGTAVYHHGLGRGSKGERVTRGDSPEKFRTATNLLWGWSVLSLTVGVGGFLFFRKLDDTVAEPF
jgi:hypothetical protein